jgi:hypothetical protein
VSKAIARRAEAGPDRALSAGQEATAPPAPFRPLLAVVSGVELCLLALLTMAPLAGLHQTISPLARAWPWLLAPAHAIFGNAAVDGEVSAERGWPALVLFAALLVVASAVAALALPICRRDPASDRRHLTLALGGAALLGLTLLLLPSLPSGDVFSYILYGRISVIHHANPLVVAPSAFPGDHFLPLVYWSGVRSVYGPVWLLASALVTLIAEALGGALATYVLLFKLLGLGAHLANAALIWAILTRIAPRRRLLGTLLYAWNPLCLLEFCASAHNDALMLTFALVGVYCLVRGWEAPALVSFGLSIATKYVLVAVVPLYLALAYRQARTRGASVRDAAIAPAWRAALVLGVVALTTAPYWAGPATLGSILYSPPAQQLDNSLLDAISWPLRAVVQLVVSRHTAAGIVDTGLKVLGLLAFALLWLRELRRVRDFDGMLAGWATVLLGYVLLASGWFWPWYATWSLAIVALLSWGELTIAALLLAGGVLTLYAFLPLFAAPVYGLRAWIAFGPTIVYLLRRRLPQPFRRILSPHPKPAATQAG